MNSSLKGFLNFLSGLGGGNNNVPDIPIPLGTEAPKPEPKKVKAAAKKTTKKKES
jgi:hypothetical protein